MSDMIAIHADIIKVTKKFVTVRCGDAEEVLKACEIEADEPLEAGQVNMQLRVLRATAEALGLSDTDEPRRATITEFNPAAKGDGIRCQDCVNYNEDENYVPDVCNECTRFGHTEGIKDNFVPAPDPDATVDITLTILTFSEDGETATVEDRHGNTADISTADFTHDADEIRAGDTLLCHVLTSAVEPTDLCPDETPGEEGEGRKGEQLCPHTIFRSGSRHWSNPARSGRPSAPLASVAMPGPANLSNSTPASEPRLAGS